jgi:hypothetical protein
VHNADVEKSPRLTRTLEVLRAFPEGATTWDIQCLTNSMAPSTDVAELRQNGYDIICQYEGQTSSKRRIFRYHLNREKENA